MLAVLALAIAAQAAPDAPVVAAPAAPVPAEPAPVVAEPLIPEHPAPATTTTTTATAPRLVDVPARGATGTMGGLSGAASGCAAGMGGSLAALGAGGGCLYFLYSGAAAGTITGIVPACTSVGTVSSMIGLATCTPVLGSSAAAAGAMYGAQSEGRDPVPALLGALPGMGLGAIATTLGVVAIGIGFASGISFGLAAPIAVLTVLAVVAGIAAPPCSACGAGVADLVWGNAPKKEATEPLAGTAGAATGPMAF
jgi:hypothetical protein